MGGTYRRFGNDDREDGGFFGGVTLMQIIWAILGFLAFMAVGMLLYFIVAFILYAIWYTVERLCGRNRSLPEEKVEHGQIVQDFSKVNRADFVETVDGIGSFIYMACGMFFLALVAATIYVMVVPE